MHIDNEYERLIKEGYIEAGTLVIHVDDITKLELSQEEVKPDLQQQGIRQDKSVVVIDKQGRMKKVSSLMFGYNKNNIQLADGSFANADDLLSAMKEAINNLDAGTIVVNKKGKVLDLQGLIRLVEETAGKVKIGERATKVTNQDSRYWSVEGAQSDIEHKKGIVFLGNDGIDLKSGDYISIDELLTALNEYMIMKPVQKPVEPTNPKPEKSEPLIVRVIRKYKNNLSRWLILLAALLMVLSGIRIKDNIQTIEVPVEYQEQIVQIINREQLDYNINGMEVEFTYESILDAQKRIVSDLKIGDEVSLQNGDTLYATSELAGSNVIIGNGLRKAGNYQISGVSIVYEGRMYAWHVDPSINNPGLEIGNFINDTITKYNLDLSKVDIRLHLGNSTNYTRTGWIDISKLIKEDTIEQQVISENAVIASTYDGVVNNFTGSKITIETMNGPVSVNVMDANGNLLEPGTTVIGSDGKEYMISDLTLSTVEYATTQTVTETRMEEQQVVNGKKLTWNIQDCSLTVGIAPLLGAIAFSVATKKKNEEAQENPVLYEFENEEEYLKFKREFEEAKEKYERTSGFKKMIKDLFYRKEVDLLQRLTEEQIQQLYATIRNYHNEDYSYNPSDRIEFRDGRIIIIFSDGKTKDITDIVMPSIAPIGKENKPVTEGLLEREEEQQNELRRR